MHSRMFSVFFSCPSFAYKQGFSSVTASHASVLTSVCMMAAWQHHCPFQDIPVKRNTARCLIFKSDRPLSMGHKKQKTRFSTCRSVSSVAQSCLTLAAPWTAARQASLSITTSQRLPKPMSIEAEMPSNHLILCRPLLLLPSIFPSIRVFSNESVLCIRTKVLHQVAKVLEFQLQHKSFQ